MRRSGLSASKVMKRQNRQESVTVGVGTTTGSVRGEKGHVVWIVRTRPIDPCIDRHIDQLRLLSQLHHTDVHRTNLSTNSGYPVPSACPRKGKRRKNYDSSTGLRYNGEPHNLPDGREWGKGGGTWSTFCMRV
jgi:hypothetical protein